MCIVNDALFQLSMNKSNTNESAILQQIERGKFSDFYLTYNRKSTDEPENQKNSIRYQRSEIARYTDREQLPIAPVTLYGFSNGGVVSECHSAFKEGDQLEILDGGEVRYRVERPKFLQVMQFLSKGCFKGVICLCPDRLSRNEGDDTVINKITRRGVDIRYVYTKYDDTSAGELHRDIDQMFSRHHSRVTREKVTGVMRDCRAAGKSTHAAPIGYLNEGNMDWKPLDPKRAPVIREMFEFYATGEWSLGGLVRYAREQGCASVPRRRPRTREEILEDEESDTRKDIPQISRPLTKNRISEILHNPFYTGKVRDIDGSYRRSTSHEPLVSEELFGRVQAKLGGNTIAVRYSDRLDYPMRGFLRCAVCGRAYTPYQQKGILYFGSRCAADCHNKRKSTNLLFIQNTVGTIIRSLPFSDEELASIDERTDSDVANLDKERKAKAARTERRIATLRSDLTYLEDNRLSLLKSGVYTPEQLIAEQDRLNKEIGEKGSEEIVDDASLSEMIDDTVKLSELVKSVAEYYEKGKSDIKERIARIIISELRVAGNTFDYIAETAFAPLKARSVLTSAQNHMYSELLGSHDQMIEAIAILTELCRSINHETKRG